MGYFTGLYAHTSVDVAILAAAGRGHIDGEPIQGSVEDFIAGECTLLRPSRVLLSHHDNFTGTADAPDLTDLTPRPRSRACTPASGAAPPRPAPSSRATSASPRTSGRPNWPNGAPRDAATGPPRSCNR